MKNTMIWGFLLFICLYASLPVHAEEDKAAVFVSPEGIRFSSYSQHWNAEKLQGLYEMLLKCAHGEELAELKEVILNPKSSTGKSGFRVGNYNVKTQTIQLYEVDSSEVNRTLIHEYGHHFTFYWLQKKEGYYPNLLTELSGWSKIRQLEGYPIRWFGSKLPYNHKWDPVEIMAEDYVLLFGVAGIALPDQAKDVVNLLRHENEYIPSPQSIPALRSFWEGIAGLTPQVPLGVPIIQQWDAVGIKGEDNGSLHMTFTPAAADGQQQIEYGINVMGFGERVSIPVKWTTGVTGSGNDLVEAQLDVNLFQEFPPNYYYIQIWSLDRANQQLTYTPFYMNWLQYNASSQQLKAISPPMENYGWQENLMREGMKQWPLINIFINGKPVTATQRHEGEDFRVYVSWRLFNKEELPTDNTNDLRFQNVWQLTANYNEHDVEYIIDNDYFLVNGTYTKLLKPLKWVGNEPFIYINDLEQMFGLSVKLDESGTGLYIELN
ncbi:hypothetical protein GC093_19040 [Paenibacillus sp. LMG 31456]|uniref:Peptidase M1 membrane alanine aminopeptidase domain-containing protein n=1 Tax=Paenibacillus foliorum TaxID=2654974 RepID=A0A972K1X5_9BACL|nr:hypothetical protein [Paenibacillus foliorum]NOU95305.1 hypothetical protein [Paenibacillus foliorum]